jgi:hypothetical protein
MAIVRKYNEHDVQNQIIDFLRYEGYFVVRQNVGARQEPVFKKGMPVLQRNGKQKQRFIQFGVKGMSDLWAVQPPNGRLICIEVKHPDNRDGATPEQISFIQNVQLKGGIAFVAASVEEVAMQLGIKLR